MGRIRGQILPILVGLATFLVFARSIGFGFIEEWDDVGVLLENTGYRGLDMAHLRWMFMATHFPAFYIPLSWLSWGLTHAISGMEPWGYHLGNVLLHAVNAGLVGVLIRTLLGIASGPTEPHDARADMAAALAAALWALHPLRLEPVVIAAARPYSLSVLFAILSTLAYLRHALGRIANRPARRPYVLALLAYAAALLSYPTPVGLFVVFLMLDVYPLSRMARGAAAGSARRLATLLMEKLPFAAMAAGSALITLLSRLNSRIMNRVPTLEEFGILSRAAQACYVAAHYIWEPFWPAGLSPVYTRLVWFKPSEPVFIAIMAFVATVTVVAILRLRGDCLTRRTSLAAFWISHLALLAPVMGLTIHPHYASDRYGHLPGIVLAVLAGAAIRRMLMRAAGPTERRVIVGAALGACLFLTALTISQTGRWRNGITLMSHVERHLNGSPYLVDTYPRLAYLHWRNHDEKRARHYVKAALNLNPNLARVIRLRGVMNQSAGMTAEAEADFRRTLELTPGDADAHYQLGLIQSGRGMKDAALAEFISACDLDAEHFRAHLRAGALLLEAGRGAEATQKLGVALKLRSDDPDALNLAGVSLAMAGRYAEAAEHFTRALEKRPDFPEARDNLERARRDMARHGPNPPH